ncbi:MAG: translocated intimin receptor Tir [Terracidiphilus sp.]
MKFSDQTGAILTDSHFLIPLIVFCIGLALLITLH